MGDIKNKIKEIIGEEELYRVELTPGQPLPKDFYDGTRCGNCQAELEPDDKYCRNCGTKRGEGRFSQLRNEMRVIYGPMRVFKCRQCGFMWNDMVGSLCPKCGGEVASSLDESMYLDDDEE